MSSGDDNIELLELNSPSSTKSFIKSKLKINDNKVHSPSTLSPIHSETKKETNELFLGKQFLFNPSQKCNVPPPKPPRRLNRKLSKNGTEATSESQDTLEKPSEELTESVFSSNTDTRSYREKFRERFESVKRQAGKSVTKANSFKTKTEKLHNLKRSIELMKKRNIEIEAELQLYEKNKEENNVSKSQTEAYLFFCEQLTENATTGSIETETERKLQKSTEVLIAIPDDYTNVSFQPADNLRFNLKLSQNELIWYPARKHLEVTEKIDTEGPRILAEEGYFQKKKINIPTSHLNILEQRLLSLNDKKWFNCEGELEICESPYRKTSFRPDTYFQKNPHLETEYLPAILNEIPEENISLSYSILNITILSLSFKHHPLFSSEHIFEQKLLHYYNEFKLNQNENKLERITKRLQALRITKQNIERTLQNSNTTDTNLNKLHNCINEIKKLREMYFEEGRKERSLIKEILKAWKTVKKIRQINKYSNTRIKLSIIKNKSNYNDEKQLWDTNIEETSTDIINELEEDYASKLQDYKKNIDIWKLQIREDSIEEESLKKPKKPIKDIDIDLITQEVTQKFKECFKPPGEPILNFNLNKDNIISDKIETSKEKLRRNAVGTTKIYLRILCNKIEVCKSKAIPLSDHFNCEINESFSLQLSTIPEIITIEINEQPTTLMKRKLGEANIQIPSRTLINQNKILVEVFKKNEIVHYKHEGVGSGVQLKEVIPDVNQEQDEILNTSGIISYNIGWDISQVNTNSYENENYEIDVVKNVLNKDGTIDLPKLIKWAQENNPDPQDPKYSILYEYIKNYDDFSAIQESPKDYFRCNPDMAPFEFCEWSDLENNLRFKVLELRAKNEPEFVGMIVPNRIKEIPLSILDDYHRRIYEERKSKLLEEDDEELKDNEIDTKRSRGRKYLKQVYTKVFQQCRNTENNFIYEDVVNEKIIPQIETILRNIISNIINWIQLRPTTRWLKPMIKRKPCERIGDLNAPVQITINVKSALNIPLRTENGASTSFIVATYQNVSLQTSNATNENPIWNEELILPLESSNTNYLSPNSLSGSIVLRLFDETITKSYGQTIKVKNWLGFIEIPISAVAYNNTIEGLFKIRKPIHLIGYKQNFESNSSTKLNLQGNSAQATYVSLKITLQPNIPKLTQNMEELETTELPYIKKYVLEWNNNYNKDYPNRKFSVLAIDTNGKTICVTRFIKSLEPPHLNSDHFNVTPEQCAQYIALIPFTDSNKFYQHVWLTTEQLLKLMIGSVIDHAIALTCYLTALGMETWLLLGYGLPHGSTAYVFIREYPKDLDTPIHSVYDIVTATKFGISDTFCPLQRIYCVINEHNVWANVQRTDQIQLTRYDFNRKSDWHPLFNNQVITPTNSIQQKLNYIITPNIQILELQIDKKIRKKFTKLRKQERTVWNHHLTRSFRNLILELENNILIKRFELTPDLKQLDAQHVMSGFVINLPYTTLSSVTAIILSTGIHLLDGINTEFVLAVKIHSFTNHVLEVWICLAGLIPK